MTRKPGRTERVTRGFELQARDLQVLSLVASARVITVEQIARDLFPSENRARRRVRGLFDHGLVQLTVIAAQAPSIVTLTREGLRLLADHAPEAARGVHLAGAIRLAGLAHRLQIVDTYLFARAFGAWSQTPLVGWSLAGGVLHQELELKRHHLDPDGIAEFETDAGERFAVACEIDRGTEPLQSVVAAKLLKYVPVADEGRLDALWLVADGGSARLTNLAALAASFGLDEWVRIIPTAHVLARPVAGLPPRRRGTTDGAPAPNTLGPEAAKERQ